MMFKAIRTAVTVLLITALSAAVFAYAETGTGTVYCDTREEAAAALREAMKAREHYASVSIFESVDEESIKTIIGEIFDMAIEHTGEPDEGDYLKYQFADYNGKAKSGIRYGMNEVTIRYVINYYSDASEESQTAEKAQAILKSLDLKGRSDSAKVRAIHDYVCDNVIYDIEKKGDNKGGTEHTAYGALVEGRSVCQGYALSMYRLLLEAGVDCRIIDGEGIDRNGGTESHSWNIVNIGDEYFYIDATWDDISQSYDYFLRNREDFEKDHVMSSEYTEDFVTEEYPVSASGYAFDYDATLKSIRKAAKSTLKAFKKADDDQSTASVSCARQFYLRS